MIRSAFRKRAGSGRCGKPAFREHSGFFCGLVLALVFALFGGVGFAQEVSSDQTQKFQAQKFQAHLVKRFLSIGTASISGVYYPLGTALARVFNSNLGEILVISEPTQGSVTNIGYLRNRDIALALVQNDVAWGAFFGKGLFEGKRFPELRILASLYSEIIQVVVRQDSTLRTMQDLRGKTVAIGEAGSGTAGNAKIILQAAGFSEQDFTSSHLVFTKAIDALQAGYVDAVFFTGGLPSEGISMLGARIPIRMIPFPEALRAHLVASYSFLERESIPSGTYPGQGEDIPTVGLRALLVTTSDLEPELANQMLALLFANIEYLSSLCPAIRGLTPATALKGVDLGMLHPGAVRFFAESGCDL